MGRRHASPPLILTLSPEREEGKRPERGEGERGQVLVLVAVVLLALIGSAALVLLAGSFEWKRNQLQQVADHAALDSALKVGIGCNAASANTVITEADNFIATQWTRTGTLGIAAGTCATPYTGTDTFAGGINATIHYPYLAHQQQVEVILTMSLPISFGATLGATNTTLTARAVGQQLSSSVPAISAGTLSCTGGQFNVAGSVLAQNAISYTGSCGIYAHTRFDAASGTYSDLGNVSVYTDAQTWVGLLGLCVPGANAGSTNAICADGYGLSGHVTPSCAANATSAFLSVGDAAINPNPCTAGKAPQPVAPRSTNLPPEPNTDPAAIATLPGATACSPTATYPSIKVKGKTVGTGNGTPYLQGGAGPIKYWHVTPGCYGYLDISQFKSDLAVLDPGFYYFNGSGFPGGGGICLNGAELAAQDVTLEFVNQAGFSTGDCTPGGSGGASCTGTCQFGSIPCSISACPPNAPFDPAGNATGGFTWFAAPCAQAPSADSSCPGSAWCPAGDRACWNLLIWAPSGNTGQIALVGAANNSWLLGSVFWPATCTFAVNGTSTIAGALSCGTLSVSAAAGAGIAVGSDYGISTALAEAVLIE